MNFFDNLHWLAFIGLVAAVVQTCAATTQRKWPTWATVLSGLVVFLAISSAALYLYRATGFPGWMRWPDQALRASSAGASVFVRPGFYSLDAAGWQHNATPLGDVFTCSTCASQVEIEIDYGPEMPADGAAPSNAAFLDTLRTDGQQQQFADSTLRASIPMQSGFEIKIEKHGLSNIGGLDVFEFHAVVDIPPSLLRETTMLGIHKNRLMKLSLHYFDNGMDDHARLAVTSLLKSLQFFA
jgi:hypothetical protein